MINYQKNIAESGLSIYHVIDTAAPYLYIPMEDLEDILTDALIGLSLKGYALRTRSKVVKSEICKHLATLFQHLLEKHNRGFRDRILMYIRKRV